jgi:geranylgeranyl diphosphate synthase type II
VSRELWADLKARQLRVEEALRSALYEHSREAPASLAEAMSYSLLAPGKRLRPLLSILACEAAGGSIEAALPAACALEMVHTYSLIHDDLPAMDDDDLRRGLPTCHKKFGEALAILAGDALLTLAFEVLAFGYGSKMASVSMKELAAGAGAAGMVGGQVLDLAAEGRLPRSDVNTIQHLENIHRRKTGAMFRTALRLGLYAAAGEREDKIDSNLLAAADDYAAAFGLAFQITDDLLDVEGSSDKAGKVVGKDAARGKLTYPSLLGVEESKQRVEELGVAAMKAAARLGSDRLIELAKYVVRRDR